MATDHSRLRELFIEACDLSAAEQNEFIDQKCVDDPELRAELQRLLRSDGATNGILADDDMSAKLQIPLDLVGQTIDKYKLLQAIGEGGFGIVYMAQQVRPVQRKVALKVIKPGMDTRDALARFEAERQALALMEHPNISRVLDAGSTESGHPFFVMELVKGVPITEYCEKQHVPVRQRLTLFRTVCQAVQHAHSKGIIHRDLKPSNVMITLHDTVPVPKIIDFGISKALNQQLTEKTLFTRYGQMLGTPMYMSPEQAELSGLDIDIRSDVYSLGVLMYELLTGTPPFSAERLQTAAYAELIRIISEEDPPTPSSRLSSLSTSKKLSDGQCKVDYRQLSLQVRGDLDRIVMKALEKDRRRRYDTVNDLARDVQRYMNDEPVTAGSPTIAYRFRKFVRRNRALVTGVSAVLAALLLGLIVSTIGFVNAIAANTRAESALLDEQEQRSRAEKEETKAKAALDREREQRERVENSLYFHRISRAQREQSVSNLETAAMILDECPDNLRGWEWNYLTNVSRANVLTLKGMSLPEISTVFSPDGKYIAAGCAKWLDRNCVGEVIVWNAQTGDVISQMEPQKGGVSELAFSPDGKRIATSNGNGGGVAVWDVATGSQVFAHASGSFNAIQYSPTEPVIAAAGADGIVRLFDSKTGTLKKNLRGHTSSIHGLGFSPDGRMLASTCHSGELIVWDAISGIVITEFEKSGNRHARFSPDGKLLVTCGYKGIYGGIFVYKIGETISQIADHRTNFGVVTRIEFSPDSQTIVLNGHGGALRIWEPVSGHEVLATPAHRQRVDHASFSPDGRQVVSSGSDLLVKSFPVSPMPNISRLDSSFVDGFAFHPNGDVAVGGGFNVSSPSRGEQSVTVMRIDENSQPAMVQKFLGAKQWITSVDYNSDGSLLAAVGSEGRVCIWDSESVEIPADKPLVIEKTRLDIRAHSGAANSVAFGPTGTRLVSGGSDGKLSIVDVENGTVERQFGNHQSSINCVDFHPQLNVVVSASADKTLKVWDAASGTELQRLLDHNSEATQIMFSPDGQICASGDATGNVILWLVDSNGGPEIFSKIKTIHCHNDRITGISFSPDQSRLATIGNDGTAGVWDLATYQEAIRLSPLGQNSEFYSVAFSPDGNQLLGGRGDKLTIWGSSGIDPDRKEHTSSQEDSVRWHQQQLEVCRNSRNWFGVVFHADRLIKLEPEYHAYYSTRGIANANRYRLDEALVDFEQAQKLGSRDPQFLAHLAMLQLHKGNHEAYQQIAIELVERFSEQPGIPPAGDQNETRNDALRVVVLGSQFLDEPIRNKAFMLSEKQNGVTDYQQLVAISLSSYRRNRYEEAFVKSNHGMGVIKGPSVVSAGLINALSNLRLSDFAAARLTFEQAAWQWEQFLAPNASESSTSWLVRAEIEHLLTEATEIFAEKQQTESFAADSWLNLSIDQRQNIAWLLNELEVSESELDWRNAVCYLDQLIVKRPLNWEFYFRRGKARSYLAVGSEQNDPNLAKEDLRKALHLRLASTDQVSHEFSGGLIVNGAEYVSAAAFPFDEHENYTVEAWVFGDWYGPLVGQRNPDNDDLFYSYARSGSFHKMSGGKQRKNFGWNHFALSCNGGTVSFYFNGRLIASQKSNDLGRLKDNGSMIIGAMATRQRFEFGKGLLRSIRFSKSARYSDSFEPPRTLESDDETFLCFEFDSDSANLSEQVPDLSGNGNHGRIIGAWEADSSKTKR